MIGEITSNIKMLRQERLSISNNNDKQQHRRIGDGKSYDVSRDGELKSFDSYTYEFESKQTSSFYEDADQNERDLYRVYPMFFNGEDEFSGSTSVLYAKNMGHAGKSTASTYERLLQDLEAEVRGHIRF